MRGKNGVPSADICLNETPLSRAVGSFMSQANEVALTMFCPNHSRVSEYND